MLPPTPRPSNLNPSDQQNNSDYRKIDSGLSKEYSAGFIIFSEINAQRHYLLLHYLSGRIDFAQGHLEAGESNLEAALREVKEETGLDQLEIIPRFEVQVNYSFRRINALINKTATLFLAHTSQTKVVISDEHKGFFWLPFKEALQQVTFEKEKRVLLDAEKYLNKLTSK